MSFDRPDVSVVIPAHNAARVIGEQLEALAGQRFEGTWEVVVVDDHSTDGTAAVARRFVQALPSLTVISTDRNVNSAHARNVGVAAARGDLLLFTDADDVVGDGWLAAMVTALREGHLVAGALETARLNEPWVRASRPDSQEHGLQKWQIPGRSWLSFGGCPNLGVPRAVWAEVGPFDEEIDYVPDMDFCFRAQLAGYDLRFVPEAVVHYRLRDSLGGIYRQARNWGEASAPIRRKFVPHGMPRPSRIRAVLTWGRVPLELLMVRNRGDLARWLHRLGWRVGRVRGALRGMTRS